ncbi:cyclic peptide export ABC transporter [filamentous cyanobacterium LEGE 11480]|uniref:Cyclic peptide export ABC transporter n=1 Tax=Romeriopsis navalis LEGE 11480 TaxID=2777977 RepID=A0A928VRC4_9CYAN|nr:cyclic peptide export ABC transporter [Romeriopsis navalis]MBE9031132.1 cyclic peptide export ABC transporter [Romeriopsis navalis LEGE 11480]
MGLIRFLLQSSWQMMALAMLSGLISGLSSAGVVAMMNYILRQWGAAQSAGVIGGFVGLALLALVAGISSQLSLIRLAQQAIFNLRMQLGRSILASELAHLDRTGSAKIMAALTDDVQALATAVWVLPFICIDFAMVLGGLGYILWLSWQVLLFVVTLILLFLGVYKKILRLAKAELKQGRAQQDVLFRHFRAITDGIKELKLNYPRRQAFLNEDLQGTSAKFKQHQTAGLSWFVLIDNFGKFAFFFSFGMLLFVLPNFLNIERSTLSGYLLTFLFVSKPLESLIARLPTLTQASVSLEKMESLNLSLSDRAEQLQPPTAINPRWDSLQLQHVHHSYPGERDDSLFTLGPISLDFQPGELVFIVGGNGSGKSTLAKILTGLYPPENGKILLDGEVIEDTTRESYRQYFTAIFAEFFLFDRLLGLDTETLESRIQSHLKELKIDHKVSLEGDRFSTTDLSTGQRKRLALLTAWLEDRPMYLFDEWAADQDPTFRRLFYTEFLPDLRSRGKTVFVISHDDHYFHVADRVIKLEYGQLEYDKQN